jgi:hypothetical protein
MLIVSVFLALPFCSAAHGSCAASAQLLQVSMHGISWILVSDWRYIRLWSLCGVFKNQARCVSIVEARTDRAMENPQCQWEPANNGKRKVWLTLRANYVVPMDQLRFDAP